jgi:hypothetical protein
VLAAAAVLGAVYAAADGVLVAAVAAAAWVVACAQCWRLLTQVWVHWTLLLLPAVLSLQYKRMIIAYGSRGHSTATLLRG